MELTFKNLIFGKTYPLYELIGNKIKTRTIKRIETHENYVKCVFLDKLGRQTSYPLTILSSAEIQKSSFRDIYFLNKKEVLRRIINKLRKEKQEINKKIINVLKELNVDKSFYFDE